MINHNRHRKTVNPHAKSADRAMNIVAVVSPMLGLPQAVQIFTTHNASGLSLFTWVTFAIVSSVYLWYALVHKIRPLIVTETLWLAVYAMVIPGILIYG